ncbi:MAG: oligosaccharide flippase family protein [Bacteroidetes bacterium]|nr:oligosaccharide flippase family protein [Bacteroidota bacterium]
MNLKSYLSSYWIRSAFYTILQRFSLTFFGLINFVILVRVLNKEEMGTWALFLTVTSVFEATKSGLLKNAHVMYVSSNNNIDEKVSIASSSFLINCAITFLFIIFLLYCSVWLSETLHSGMELSNTLIWFIPGLLFMIFFSHFEAIQQSHLDFKGILAGYLVRQAIFFIFLAVTFLLKKPFTLTNIALYLSISIFCGAIALYFFSKQYIHHLFKPTKAWTKKIFQYGGYIFGSGVMSNIFSNLDQVMTGAFISSSAVAYYNTASKINGLVDVPSYAAADIIFPKTSRAAVEEGNAKVKYLYERMVGVLLSFTTPCALFIIIFPKFIITIIAGSAYVDAAPILQLYMITGLMRPMQNQAANLINSIGKPALCFVVNTVSLAINLLISYFCIRYIHFYGAAVGTLIAGTIGFTIWYFVMKKEINLQMGKVFEYILMTYKDLFKRISTFFKKARLNSESNNAS